MLGDKLSPGTKPGFLKSEKMLGFKLLYIHKSVFPIHFYGYIYKSVFPIHFYGYIKV